MEVLERLGKADKPELSETIASRDMTFGILVQRSQGSGQNIQSRQVTLGNRVDLRDIPFVTIDSATTEDMDDALFAERTDNGWRLRVAIADPTGIY